MAKNELIWSFHDGPFQFSWDLQQDRATVTRNGVTNPLWLGGLLPLFEVIADGANRGVSARVDFRGTRLDESGATIALTVPGLGEGTLQVRTKDRSVQFESLSMRWHSASPPELVALYFGAKPLTVEQRAIVPDLSKDFWPSWQCEGYCIPAVKGGPEQHFFRRWELGHATLPLGSFGPALGTPYAAAFPRPLYSAALGGPDGWVAIGCGDVPDGAMLLQIRASAAHLEYRYREDLWGPPPGIERTWREPLRLAFAELAWDAYDRLFDTFPKPGAVEARHQPAMWNTWGDFRLGRFDLRRIIDTAHGQLSAEMLCIDDFWETFNSSGVPDLKRFPQFHEDVAHARKLGLEIGFWQASGWVVDPAACGLSADDLLLGVDGLPRRSNWGLNPHESGNKPFCLDPSSPRTRAFLQDRTRRVIGGLGATLLKVDFAYGLPGPDTSAPRDPALRGERLGFILMKTIADAARSANPKVTLEFFGIHPLLRPFCDLLALDDLGDAGGNVDVSYETNAHAQWSIWAALAGVRGTAINASGGYNEAAESEIMLNTAVIGAPGTMLPCEAYDDSPAGRARRCRRTALARWRRRTTQWRPLWLDSEPGRLGLEPFLRSWGRLESINGQQQLTSVALRKPSGKSNVPVVPGVSRWDGRWALIAQDDEGIADARKLAVIPFDAGAIELRLRNEPTEVTAICGDGDRPARAKRIGNDTLRIEVSNADLDGLIGFVVA